MRNASANAFAVRTVDLHTTDIRSCCSRRRICKPLHVPNLRSERSFLHCQFHRYLLSREHAAFQYTECRSTIDTWGEGGGGRQMEHRWTRKPAWRKATPLVRTWRNQYSEALTTRNFRVEIVENTSVYPSEFFESSKCQRAMTDQIRSVFRGYPEETGVRF